MPVWLGPVEIEREVAGETERVACARVPDRPQDLIRHVCINMRHETAGGLHAWEFGRDGKELRVRVDGQLTLNNSYAMIDAAVNGCGIAYVPEDIVERHIDLYDDERRFLRTDISPWDEAEPLTIRLTAHDRFRP